MRQDNLFIEGTNDRGSRAAMDSSDHVWRERGLQAAVLAGDERAWETLYEESFDGLHAYVSWRCGGHQDRAEDVLQETWLTAVRRIRSFEPDRGSFANWMRGIAANVLRNYFRSLAHRNGRIEDLEQEPTVRSTADSELDEQERSRRIARALAALPERYEAVLRAKYLDEQSVTEVADAWKETEKAIESLLSRARQAFREAFQKLE